MLTQYKNITQNLNAKSFSAERIDQTKSDFVSYDANQAILQNDEILNVSKDSKIELHVYSGDTWLTGNHSVQLQTKIPSYRNRITNKPINIVNPIGINLYGELENLKLTAGNFRIAVNFFKNLIGSYDRQHLRIDEISPDRTEIRLRAIDGDDPEFLQQITSYIRSVKQTSAEFYKTYLLNFSRNQCVLFVNSVVIGEYLYVKLYEPLPLEFNEDFKCWIVEEQKPAYIDRVAIAAKQLQKKFNKLANPNWQATSKFTTSNETGLRTWTDLLGSSTQTSQQIVDAYFSGSLSGVKLNIDYSDFNNFIFYSSATERLENFLYKLQLLEYYTSQSIAVAQISGSTATTNQTDFLNLKTNLISGLDSFEHYLYFQSSSVITTYDIPLESPTVASITGSYIKPVPKTNSTYPYTLTSTTSNEFKQWYDNVYSSASLYDIENINSLSYTIPEFIRLDPKNVDTVTFVNMLGHHYDILYTYINHMTKINKREENPKLGMPNELLYSVAKQFGWNLTDGNQSQELWQYLLGTDETGTPLTGSNSVGDPSVPGRDMTYTIWRRIVNNLPYLLKTKGTKRSIQALLSCYGIPQSFISINEYGGPRLERAPVYEKLNFDYALDLITNTSGTVNINYTAPINAFELRFRLDNVEVNPLIPSTMNLVTVGSNNVTIDFVSGNKGVVSINGNATDPIEIFDGQWATMLLRNDGLDSELLIKKSKYGKIVAAVSASDIGSAFSGTGNVLLGGTTSGSRLYGQLQELRLWSSSLQDSPFDNHVKAPAAYDGNVDAYDELLFRLPLTQNIDHSQTGSLLGVQPKQSNVSASFSGWTNAIPYDSIEETYYYDGVSLGAGTYDDNKVRIESNDLVGTLDVKTRAERSQFDKAPLDSKKLGVYFSPQTMIDEDIIAQYGFTDLDQYIGDPGSTDEKSYPRLIQFAQGYWKKYSQRNNINDYIKMFTLFDLSFFKQLDQILPARASKLTGILIQPNLLERSKDTILPTITRYDNGYSVIIDTVAPSASGNYLQYTSSIDGKILSISAQDDDQWQMYLTASTADKYDGVAYSHEYLVLSGSTYITASTPYWLSEGLCPAITSSVVSEFKQQDANAIILRVKVASATRIQTATYDLASSITWLTGTPSVDGVSLSVGDSILLKDGNRTGTAVTGSSNGIYVVDDISVTTTLIRSSSYDIDPDYLQLIFVESGSVNRNRYFIQTTDNPVTDQQLSSTSPLIPSYSIRDTNLLYEFVEVQDYAPTGIENHRYSGTKMTSPAFNVNSTQTYDGGPVAEWRTANPNQLIYQNNGEQGSFRLA